MQFETTKLPGVFIIRPDVRRDMRGSFVKTFHADVFQRQGIAFEPREMFYSVSARDVVRGLHFQRPPSAHAKLVSVLAGAARDVVLDLRRTQPTYGAHVTMELSAENAVSLYLPEGVAHGFASRADGTVMTYATTAVYDPANDVGVRWDSFGCDWGVSSPQVSPRDAAFPAFAEFISPFA